VKKKLKSLKRGVGVQLPQQLREARKALLPTLKEEEDKNHHVQINKNKLYVNGKLHKLYIDGKVCDPQRGMPKQQ
jgi:hypothetical protein